MNRKKISIVLIVIAVTALPFASCMQLSGPKGEITITKLNSPGEMAPVKFIHDKHEMKDVKCIRCHHKLNNDERIKICGSVNCHTGAGAEERIHNLCITCHKSNKRIAPVECAGCHTLESEEKK